MPTKVECQACSVVNVLGDFATGAIACTACGSPLGGPAPQSAPPLVDRGGSARKPTRRVKTGLEVDLEQQGPGVLKTAAVFGAFLAADAADGEVDGWWALAARSALEPRHEPEHERNDPPLLADFRRFVLLRRVERHGEELVARRLVGAKLTQEQVRDLRVAVGLAVNLVLSLMDDDSAQARQDWQEIATRFDVEPAYELVHDLLVETELVSTTLLGSVLRRWWHAAKASRTMIPEDMIPAAERKRPKRRRPPRRLRGY